MRPLFALLLFCIAPALFAAPPARIEASYDVTTKGIKIAEIKEDFTRTGNKYRIVSVTKPVGLLAVFRPDTLQVVSEGEITKNGLRPQKFLYQRSQETLKNTAADFDWRQSTLKLSDRQGIRSEPLPAATQDRLSALYQFRYEPLLHERKEVTMRITNGSKIDTRQYSIKAKQTVDVPLGTLKSLYLSTAPQQTAWKTEMWLSTENGNFPCKIILTEDNGDKLMQVLTALSITQ
jgi:hypothetical protein